MTSTFKNAPAIIAEQWYNTHQAPDLNQLRGRMVVLEAFQMLCPGCVQHGLPQVQRIHDVFSRRTSWCWVCTQYLSTTPP